ncbi:response regulator transcription factor [Lysinibacillus sp. KU-BSD001]|uniref:response regulator transcription factor n=1 Tax=Lysinibacillus sp. KU-BSD001 TaxID=3141328 RepID=UPI0036E23BBF
MVKILIVEDVEDVNAMLKELFTTSGYQVFCAFDGLQAQQIFMQESIDLVLLDIMLPYKSGDELLKEIRTISDVPVLMISAKDLVSTKIDLLRLGADDYITKPFDLGEVLARAEAALRRANKTKLQPKKLLFKGIELDDEAKRVYIDGQEVVLTATEYALLSLFLHHQEKVFTKANLYESVWHEDYLGDDHIIKTHISNLRNKLKSINPETDYIETIRGLGYRLNQSC